MARPRKVGVDYFPHDVHASRDLKIEAIEARYGNDGYAFVFKLFERLYAEGGLLDLSKPETRAILAAKTFNISREKFDEMLEFAVKQKIFARNRGVVESERVSSQIETIQKKRGISRSKQGVSEAETPPIDEFRTPKGKERKVKESKGKETSCASAASSAAPPDPLPLTPPEIDSLRIEFGDEPVYETIPLCRAQLEKQGRIAEKPLAEARAFLLRERNNQWGWWKRNADAARREASKPPSANVRNQAATVDTVKRILAGAA